MERHFKIEDNRIAHLKELGFLHMGDGVYSYKFPAYKNNGFVTLWGRFIAFDDNDSIFVDILQEGGDLYAPYYQSSPDNDVIAICISNISKEMRKLGIYISVERKRKTRTVHKGTYVVKGSNNGRKEISC